MNQQSLQLRMEQMNRKKKVLPKIKRYKRIRKRILSRVQQKLMRVRIR